MIRSRPGGGLFARSRCPFDDEGAVCERPFCPFFHPFSASKHLVKVKEEIQDDDIIVVHEKVIPIRSPWPSSSTESHAVSNAVETQPVVFDTSMLHKESPVIDQYSCGYLGYVAPNSTDCETNNLASPSVYASSATEHIQGSENQCTSNLLPKIPNLPNTLSTGKNM
ncbi:unnamed protein product [Meloidogyne enterolobii]|uniref:Uncharacterized protein n=1 Tax=Meloidogyne enterolobii TaxID=390850 RepID=A0ACB0Y8U2_MELEN